MATCLCEFDLPLEIEEIVHIFHFLGTYLNTSMQTPAFLGENNIYQSEWVLPKVILAQLHTYNHKIS